MNRIPPSQILHRWPAALLAATLTFAPSLHAQKVADTTTTATTEATTASQDAAAKAKKKTPVVTKAAESASEDTVKLSPFQVSANRDKGYEASSTLSGTRLNSNLSDLAASISVVTRQQLLDTAATDINDVFKYEANTEGIYQWSNYTVDRGTLTDSVSMDPQGSNRVRGLNSANVANRGFSTSLPFDTYNVDAVEISRGPNSSLFGLGNTGGGVNIISAQANDTKNSTSFTTRGDSYGGYRGTFDVNRALIKGRLAIRAMGVYDDKAFQQEPSHDTTRRMEVALTARPFKNTVIRASFESYRNFAQRPNSFTPRDMTTDWIASGKPTWDPTSLTVHLADGTSISYSTMSSNSAKYYGVALVDTAFTTYPSWYIENGQVQLYAINRMPSSSGTGPNNVSGSYYLLQNGSYYIRNQTSFPLYQPLGVSDKSLYNWSKINLVSPNYIKTKGETSAVEIEQTFLNTPRHLLALQAGWLYERSSSFDRRFLGNGTTNLQTYIDINEKLLDGTTNPYFLRTYIGGSQPIYKKIRNNNENYRATLAYQLDLSNERGWLRWLGRNRFSGYGEYRSIYAGSLGYKDTMSSTESWMGTVTSRNSASYRAYPRFYVGDAVGQNVDYAPIGMATPPYSLNLRYYNGSTSTWANESVDFDEYYYANRLNRRLLSTYGGVWQGFFLKDRIIPTFGIRKDFNRTRDGNSAISPTAATNGYYDTSSMDTYSAYDWVSRKGKTTNAGIVVKPLRWLSLTYSQSDSFSPGSLAYDVEGVALPDPTGKTKDYGFSLNLFNDRLIITAKQYETLDRGRGTSDINTIVQRADRMNYRTSSGDPGLGTFLYTQYQTLNSTWTDDQLDAAVLSATGIDMTYMAGHINKTHGDNSDAISRGKEIEIIYNPTPFWTIKTTLTESRPLNGVMSPAVQNYITKWMPIWTTIKDPVSGSTWWTMTAANGTVARDWYTSNVLANLKLAIATQGKRRTQTREHRINLVTNYKLAGITQNRWFKPLDIGGSIRWEEKASIGYYGAAADSDGIVRELNANLPIWDKPRYYFDFMAGYNLRLLKGKVACRLQLNVVNVFENGRIQAIAVNPDGTPWAYRIVDPRQIMLTASFSL